MIRTWFPWNLLAFLGAAVFDTAFCRATTFCGVVTPCWQPSSGQLFWKEVGDFDLQGRRQRRNDQKRGIALAPFHSADIGPVVLGAVGKLFLTPATFQAEGPQSLTKLFLNWLHIGMKPLYSL
jgi:hypothetical protein